MTTSETRTRDAGTENCMCGCGHTNTPGHPEESRRIIRQARSEFEADDLVQASEKAWGAAAHAVKAAAEARGLPHHRHRELIRAVTNLAIETRQEDLQRYFHVAEALHANFYEDWMPTEMVRRNISDVERFIAQMEPLYDEQAP